MAEANGAGSPSSSEEARERRLFVEAILRTMRQPLVVLNGELEIATANRAFYETFGVNREETEGRTVYALGNGQWDIPDLKRLLEDTLPSNGEVTNFKVEHDFEQIGRRVMILNAHRMERGGRDDRILLAIEDVTEWERDRWELEGQKEFAEKVLDSARDALLILGWDLRVRTANETFYNTFMVEKSETEGRMIYDLGNGQWDIPKLRELLENVLPNNDAFDDFEVEHEFDKIGHRIMVLNGRRVDHMQLILLAIEDQTEARRAAAALSESEAKFRVLIESTANTVWEADPDGRVHESTSWSSFTGQSAEEMRGDGWLEALHPDDRERAWREWRDCISAECDLRIEVRLQHVDGGWRWTRCNAAPVRGPDGQIVRWVGMGSDIAARKEAEEQRELLLGELNHRVKNIFAIIRSLASQSDGERSTDEFRRVFLGRLDALVNAHSLALESRWESVDLARLAEQTMRPYSGERPDAVEIRGGSLELDPRPALSLSLVLHELATNALKYGALSTAEGRVQLEWHTADGDGHKVHFTWCETGGPPISPPKRTGFGTRLVERVFEYELGGESTLEFREDGLRVEAWFPLG